MHGGVIELDLVVLWYERMRSVIELDLLVLRSG